MAATAVTQSHREERAIRQRPGPRPHVEGVRVPAWRGLPLAHQPGEAFEYGHSCRRAGDGSSRSPRVCRSISFFDNSRVQAARHGRHRFLGAAGVKLARLIHPAGWRSRGSSGDGGEGRYQTDHAVLGRRRAGVDGRRRSAVSARCCSTAASSMEPHILSPATVPTDDHERATARDPFRQLRGGGGGGGGLDLWVSARGSAAMPRGARCPGSVGSFFWSGVLGVPTSGSTRRSSWLPCS